jgi:hypothetical protein
MITRRIAFYTTHIIVQLSWSSYALHWPEIVPVRLSDVRSIGVGIGVTHTHKEASVPLSHMKTLQIHSEFGTTGASQVLHSAKIYATTCINIAF